MIRLAYLRQRIRGEFNVSHGRRFYKVLALESSCDDACVALLEKQENQPARIIDQFKETLNSSKTGGIIPTDAHAFHQHSMANLVNKFCSKHQLGPKSPPALICCTRGPGMVGSLSASLQLAKGLSIGWGVPLIGVHHMLGHILTANLPKSDQPELGAPKYPFLSLLCSGGHTMLVLLTSLTQHEIIINTADIAAGDSLDKCARELGMVGNMLGRELEQFVKEISPEMIEEFKEIDTNSRDNKFNFQLCLPLRSPKHLKIPPTLEFSFASFLSTIQGYKKKYFQGKELDASTKKFIAFKVQDMLFDHIINRINIAITKHGVDMKDYDRADKKFNGVRDFICSGGVMSNSILREKIYNNLKCYNLNELLPKQVNFHFPDIALCTDNAVMIGVAGIDIFEKLNIKSDLNILPIRKWPMNELLTVDGWITMDRDEINRIRH